MDLVASCKVIQFVFFFSFGPVFSWYFVVSIGFVIVVLVFSSGVVIWKIA